MVAARIELMPDFKTVAARDLPRQGVASRIFVAMYEARKPLDSREIAERTGLDHRAVYAFGLPLLLNLSKIVEKTNGEGVKLYAIKRPSRDCSVINNKES